MGTPLSEPEFYSLIAERMADDILLVMAKRDGRYIAGAINFIGGDRLFGRHWGCIEHHPCLHFESLLLSGDRIRHRLEAAIRRGRRAGRTQAGARLHAGDDPFGALHPERELPPRGRRTISSMSARTSPAFPKCCRNTALSKRKIDLLLPH
jgi:hypothetical protein